MARTDRPPGYHGLVASLSLGQILSWAAVYYGFSSFVLPMMGELGWSKATVMGASTLGLLVWGLATYGAGAAVDRGHARALMGGGCACAALGFATWASATEPSALYAAWVLLGLASAAILYEPAFNVVTRRFPGHYREGITTLTLVAGFASTLSFPAVALLIEAFAIAAYHIYIPVADPFARKITEGVVKDEYTHLNYGQEWLKANLEASRAELEQANRDNLPHVRRMLERVANDAAVLHMEKEDLIEDFLIAYQEALTEIGFQPREIARMAAAALAG